MRIILKLLVVCLAIGSFQGCVSKKKYDELTAAKEATDAALAETQEKVKNLESENEELEATLESEKARLNGEISSIKSDLDATKSQVAQVQEKLNMTEAELNELKAEIDGIFGAYKNSGLSLEERDGRLYVVTSNPVTFRSSSASLNKEARDAVDALAETLKANPELNILVVGHTDNVPFKADIGSDNWDLSYRRAKSVVKRLVKAGVDASQLTVAGKGDTAPVADNDSAEGKAQNRRTVIQPDPALGDIIKN